MNLEQLTPEPWVAAEGQVADATLDTRVAECSGMVDDETALANSEFIALARNAFAVMMRRGWHVERFSLMGGGFAWRIPLNVANDMIRQQGANAAQFVRYADIAKWSDPFTALLEADRWYKENVEALAHVQG